MLCADYVLIKFCGVGILLKVDAEISFVLKFVRWGFGFGLGDSFFVFFHLPLVFFRNFANIVSLDWLDGRVVMQRTATPCTPVRFRLQPPSFNSFCTVLVCI